MKTKLSQTVELTSARVSVVDSGQLRRPWVGLGAGEGAATGAALVLVRFASPDAVRRWSLAADARVLRGRGLTRREIGSLLGVGASTVGRWLA